jgi:hypothetical protein
MTAKPKTHLSVTVISTSKKHVSEFLRPTMPLNKI